MRTGTDPKDLKPGDIVRYQEEHMPEPTFAVVKRNTGTAIVLEDNEPIPYSAWYDRVPEPPQEIPTCAECGKPIPEERRSATTKYCSKKCMKRVSNRRQRQKAKAPEQEPETELLIPTEDNPEILAPSTQEPETAPVVPDPIDQASQLAAELSRIADQVRRMASTMGTARRLAKLVLDMTEEA